MVFTICTVKSYVQYNVHIQPSDSTTMRDHIVAIYKGNNAVLQMYL